MVQTGLFLAFVTLNLAFYSVSSQFYVDIEHALPRIGKRYEGKQDHDEFSLITTSKLVSALKNEIYSNLEKMSSEESRVYLFKALQLLKLIRKKESSYENASFDK